jgi:hypothetical protein
MEWTTLNSSGNGNSNRYTLPLHTAPVTGLVVETMVYCPGYYTKEGKQKLTDMSAHCNSILMAIMGHSFEQGAQSLGCQL